MTIEELRRLRSQIDMAIGMEEAGLLVPTTPHEQMVHRIMYGEDAVLIGDYMIKPRPTQPARADEG
jgi:hypothetical protein